MYRADTAHENGGPSQTTLIEVLHACSVNTFSEVSGFIDICGSLRICTQNCSENNRTLRKTARLPAGNPDIIGGCWFIHLPETKKRNCIHLHVVHEALQQIRSPNVEVNATPTNYYRNGLKKVKPSPALYLWETCQGLDQSYSVFC